MRTFAPYGLLLRAASLVDNDLSLAYALLGLGVELHDPYRTVSGVLRLVVGGVVIVDDVGTSVIVEEEGRIYALHFRKIYRIAPLSEGVLCLYKKIAGSDIGSDHIICLVGRIVLYVGSKDASAHMLMPEVLKL